MSDNPKETNKINNDLDTFPKLLLDHAKKRPNKDAIREKDLGIWQKWTWSKAAEEISALANGLIWEKNLVMTFHTF